MIKADDIEKAIFDAMQAFSRDDVSQSGQDAIDAVVRWTAHNGNTGMASEDLRLFASWLTKAADALDDVPPVPETDGCGAKGPHGYRCTHHSDIEHISRGSNPGSFAEAWPLDDDDTLPRTAQEYDPNYEERSGVPK